MECHSLQGFGAFLFGSEQQPITAKLAEAPQHPGTEPAISRALPSHSFVAIDLQVKQLLKLQSAFWLEGQLPALGFLRGLTVCAWACHCPEVDEMREGR